MVSILDQAQAQDLSDDKRASAEKGGDTASQQFQPPPRGSSQFARRGPAQNGLPKIFANIDADDSRSISREEWDAAFDEITRLGQYGEYGRYGGGNTRITKADWLRICNRDSKEEVGLYDAIVRPWEDDGIYTENGISRVEWKRAFDRLDKDRNGFITLIEWKSKLASTGPPPPRQEPPAADRDLPFGIRSGVALTDPYAWRDAHREARKQRGEVLTAEEEQNRQDLRCAQALSREKQEQRERRASLEADKRGGASSGLPGQQAAVARRQAGLQMPRRGADAKSPRHSAGGAHSSPRGGGPLSQRRDRREVPLFQLLDLDQSETITREEWLAAFGRLAGGKAGVSRKQWALFGGTNAVFDAMSGASADVAPVLTLADWGRCFDRLDENGDGAISLQEWASAAVETGSSSYLVAEPRRRRSA